MTSEVGSVNPSHNRKTLILEKALSGENPLVFQKESGRVTLDIHLCGKDRSEDILKLQQSVYEQIPDKDTFVLTTKEELAESLEHDFCIGAFSGDELAAFTLMVSNRISPRNLGFLLRNTARAAHTSVTYDTTFVAPGYVGFGLQRFFITLKGKIAVLLGADKAYATVSPENGISLFNMRSNGFETAEKKQMYGSYMRYILCKRLK